MISYGVIHNIGGLDGLTKIGKALRVAQLAPFALKTMKDRVAKGIGSDDAPMPPLKDSGTKIRVFSARVGGKAVFKDAPGGGYAGWKSRHGLQPIRDLAGDGSQGGHMMDNLTVRFATDQRIAIAFTARKARQKALANQKLAPFCSWSENDQALIRAEAEKLFMAGVNILEKSITRRRAA